VPKLGFRRREVPFGCEIGSSTVSQGVAGQRSAGRVDTCVATEASNQAGERPRTIPRPNAGKPERVSVVVLRVVCTDSHSSSAFADRAVRLVRQFSSFLLDSSRGMRSSLLSVSTHPGRARRTSTGRSAASRHVSIIDDSRQSPVASAASRNCRLPLRVRKSRGPSLPDESNIRSCVHSSTWCLRCIQSWYRASASSILPFVEDVTSR